MVAERILVEIPGGSGRKVDVLVTGPEEGLPLVFHNGTPGGLVPFEPLTSAAEIRGLRVVTAARPGYERSTPWPGRSVADAVGDIAPVLDALGADSFLTAGWSGGGPHALAAAARFRGRCLAAASIAGVAPHRPEGLDWTAGMGPENVAEFGAAERGETDLSQYLEGEAANLREVEGPDVAEALGGLVSDADKAVVTGEFASYLADSLKSAVRGSIAGWRDDDLAFVREWGFELSHTGPVAIWQGDQDRMVPYAHGAWLAKRVRGARVHLLPGEGHLTLTTTHLGPILDDLLELAGLTGR
jgi:pimeloyl-ACP methyl ester carboxylesterase